jgi:hypothetical protein
MGSWSWKTSQKAGLEQLLKIRSDELCFNVARKYLGKSRFVMELTRDASHFPDVHSLERNLRQCYGTLWAYRGKSGTQHCKLQFAAVSDRVLIGFRANFLNAH